MMPSVPQVRRASRPEGRWSPHWLAGGVTVALHALGLALLLQSGPGVDSVPVSNAAVESAGVRVQLRFVAPSQPQPAAAAQQAASTSSSAAPAPAAIAPKPVSRPARSTATAPLAVVDSDAPVTASAGQMAAAVAMPPPATQALAATQAPAGQSPAPAQGAGQGHAASPGAAASSTAAAAGAPPVGEVEAAWAQAVMQRLEKFRVYPPAARAHRIQGTVLVQASIARDGRVMAARVGRSCGNADLDAEAVAAFRRARKVPPPPAHLAADPLQVDLPVAFSLS